jgi:hypothetical protein
MICLNKVHLEGEGIGGGREDGNMMEGGGGACRMRHHAVEQIALVKEPLLPCEILGQKKCRVEVKAYAVRVHLSDAAQEPMLTVYPRRNTSPRLQRSAARPNYGQRNGHCRATEIDVMQQMVRRAFAHPELEIKARVCGEEGDGGQGISGSRGGCTGGRRVGCRGHG